MGWLAWHSRPFKDGMAGLARPISYPDTMLLPSLEVEKSASEANRRLAVLQLELDEKTDKVERVRREAAMVMTKHSRATAHRLLCITSCLRPAARKGGRQGSQAGETRA